MWLATMKIYLQVDKVKWTNSLMTEIAAKHYVCANERSDVLRIGGVFLFASHDYHDGSINK